MEIIIINQRHEQAIKRIVHKARTGYHNVTASDRLGFSVIENGKSRFLIIDISIPSETIQILWTT